MRPRPRPRLSASGPPRDRLAGRDVSRRRRARRDGPGPSKKSSEDGAPASIIPRKSAPIADAPPNPPGPLRHAFAGSAAGPPRPFRPRGSEVRARGNIADGAPGGRRREGHPSASRFPTPGVAGSRRAPVPWRQRLMPASGRVSCRRGPIVRVRVEEPGTSATRIPLLACDFYGPLSKSRVFRSRHDLPATRSARDKPNGPDLAARNGANPGNFRAERTRFPAAVTGRDRPQRDRNGFSASNFRRPAPGGGDWRRPRRGR